MISLIKSIFFVGFIIVTLALLAALIQDFNAKNMMIQEFNKKTNGSDIERPEHIKVPSNSRPILAPCDWDK